MTKYAVIGVSESTGREILSALSEAGISSKNVYALEPRSALGNMFSYGEEDELDILGLDGFDFSKVDVAIFTTVKEVSKKYIPTAVKSCKVIDCSNAYFGDPDVPMIVDGLNDQNLSQAKKGIISVPSADVTQLLLPLKNINEEYGIKRIVVSVYTAASVYGKDGMDELFNQTRKIFMNDTLVDDQKVFKKQIAFNVIPQVGEFIGDETSAEWSFNSEVKQVLNPDVKVHANCAVIPAFIGCGQFVNIECAKDIDVEDARNLMKKVPGVVVFDKHVDGGYVTINDVQGENDIYISRMRQDTSVENGISFWCVADNFRAGMARNVLSLAQKLVK